MTAFAKFALILIVFIDIIGQGLVFPIVDTLVMDPSSGFLAEGTPAATRSFTYGAIISSFFIAWFIGAPYVSRLSDIIGRKPAILICLFGSLIGYAITVLSLYTGNLWLLILGRVVTGFTAGNQPIAQAAMIDGSKDEADRGRNMGLIMVGTAAGLIGGPLIGGLASDPAVFGSWASLKLPFFIALGIVAFAIVCIMVGFKDVRQVREPFRFRALELVDIVSRLLGRPLVLRLSLVLLLFHIANATFYIFIENFMGQRFGLHTLGTSGVMLTIGAAIALASIVFLPVVQTRFDRRTIVGAAFIAWVFASLAVTFSASLILSYALVFVFYFTFGLAYPTLIAAFSLSVDADEQGWVMGITIAIFTLVGGVMALVGGWLTGIAPALPFDLSAVAAVLALIALAVFCRGPAMDRIMRRA